MSSATRSTFGRLGLTALAVIFVVTVSLTNVILRGARLDLTENNLYTLADGTTKVLGGIGEPINVYLFFSNRATTDIPYLRAYAQRVREMLQEFSARAGGKLKVTEVDPLPFSDEEDRASQFGLQGIKLETTPDPIYLGIAATNSVGDEEIIGFLDPSKEAFLEYDLAKLVYTLASPKRPVIGLLSGLPMSAGFDPQTQQVRQPWVITNQIRQLFELRQLEVAPAKIDDDISVLMVVHPKGLQEATLYAIDQFILRGGRALLFVDPYAEADPGGADPNDPAAAFTAVRSSSLNRLLEAWGVMVAEDKFVGDDRYALQVMGPNQRPVRAIGLLGVNKEGLDASDVITAGLNVVNLGFAGTITRKDDAAAKLTPLIQTSDLAGPVPATSLGFMMDPEMLRENFNPTGEHYTVAARLSGKVPSAFPDGPPGGAAPEGAKPHLAAAENPINVVLVADTDMLSDRLWVQQQNFFGQRVSTAFANNGDFVVNALDNLAGSGDLIGIRSRATFSRPFVKVQELRLDAEKKFRVTEERLKQELRDTEQKLGELQARREDRDASILTPEQEQELERFRDQRLEIRRELRQVQRNLDQSIEDLGTSLKVINIGLMPVLISLVSLALLTIRRRHRKGQAAA
jgi:ABC-type uncharacterized transport system involved in gliding motility auxiliary subunit